MAKPKDYYELLGVERKASADEIRSAYRKLARKLHPDVNKATDAAKRFSEIQEAYDVLSDLEKRKNYDRFGHAGPGMGGGPRNPAGGTGPGTGPFEGGYYGANPSGGWTNVGTSGIGDEDAQSIFEQMFGGGDAGRGFGRGGSPFGATGGGGGARTRTKSQSQKGSDIEHTITVTFLTAALGGTEQLRMSSAGQDGDVQSISVKIPPGIESGSKLRVRGKGMPGTNGGPAGDIIITVQVGQHPYFRREGLDLLLDIPITIVEAVQGVSVRVPLLSGTAQIKIPPGASSGKRLRIKGKGIVDAKGKAGDFHAVMQITAPPENQLSDNARKALNEVATELQNPRESAPWADDVKARIA